MDDNLKHHLNRLIFDLVNAGDSYAHQLAEEICMKFHGTYPTDAILEDGLYNGKSFTGMSLGRLGGLIGGERRAQVLSPQRRREIARKAANARWNKQIPSPVS